jgi:PAS domain S-box-containing protein
MEKLINYFFNISKQLLWSFIYFTNHIIHKIYYTLALKYEYMSNVTILVVEDDAVEAMDIQKSLELLGYTVQESAYSGEEVLEKLLKFKPDLILMDIVLSGDIDGIETAEIIKKKYNIPIIYLTAHSEENTVERAKLTEPYAYLIKPFDSDELKRSIEMAVFKHKMDEKLENRKDHFQNIFENAPVGIFNSTPDGKFCRVNKALSDMFGYDSPEELIYEVNKTNITEKLYVKRDRRPEFVDEVIRDEKWHSYKNRYYRKDGSIMTGELSFRAVKDENREIKYLEGFVKDVSKEIEAEMALKESESRYRLISENTGDVIWILDINSNKFTYMSPSVYNLRGFTPEEVLNQSAEEVMTSESYKSISNELPFRIQRFMSGDESERIRTSLVDQIHKDGSIIPTEVVTTLLLDNKGRISEVLGVSRDISERIKMEESLVESEERNRLLIENAGMGIGYYDLDGRIIMYNKIAANQLNGIPEDFSGKLLKEIYDEESAVLYEERLEKAIKSSESQVYEDYILLPKEDKWFLSTFTRIENADGRIVGVQVISNDVTVLKTAQKERDRFFNLSTDMLCIAGIDGYFKQLNPAWEKSLGWSNEELLSKHYIEFVHPEDKEFTLIFTEGLKGENSHSIFENRYLTKDGSYRWLSWSVNLLRDEGLIFADVRDITEQKISAKALKESEEKYRALFEADPDYTILTGAHGIIIDVNKSTTDLIGLSREEIIGKDLRNIKILFEDDLELYNEKVNDLIQGNEMKSFEARLIDKEGKLRWVNITVSAIEMEEDIHFILIIASDITNNKQFEKELKDSIREKEVLLQEIHHRVKNNMQIISSLLNLQTRYLDDIESVNVLKESQNRVRSMAMIHEKLYRSKDFNKIYFDDYIESLVWDLFYSYSIKKGTIEPILDIDNVKLNIETSVPCGLIITELVSNSLKYAFPDQNKGELLVSLKTKGDCYELIISDDGVGFPEDIDFKHTDSLGLELVNSLTDQIDGEIELDRSHGTKFKIRFKELVYKERV